MTDNNKPPIIIAAFPSPDEKEMVAFFYSLGNCVNRWAFVDRALYRLSRFALKLDHRQSAFLYYRQRAFHQHLRFADQVLRTILPKEQISNEWIPLHNKVEHLSKTRNIFAHHPAKRLGTSKDGKPHYIWTIHIEPAERILNWEYDGLQGKMELGIEDLEKHILDVETLELELRSFLRKIYLASVMPKNGVDRIDPI